MLSKGVENTVGKGEIACYKQFLLFPQCFQKACFQGPSKGVIVWEWVKPGFEPFNRPQNLSLVKIQSTCRQKLTLSQRTDVKLFQIETVCR